MIEEGCRAQARRLWCAEGCFQSGDAGVGGPLFVFQSSKHDQLDVKKDNLWTVMKAHGNTLTEKLYLHRQLLHTHSHTLKRTTCTQPVWLVGMRWLLLTYQFDPGFTRVASVVTTKRVCVCVCVRVCVCVCVCGVRANVAYGDILINLQAACALPFHSCWLC